MRKNSAQFSMWSESIVDSFTGGGGASTGIEMATGRPVDIASRSHVAGMRCAHRWQLRLFAQTSKSGVKKGRLRQWKHSTKLSQYDGGGDSWQCQQNTSPLAI